MPGQTESEVCLGGVIHISHASHVSGRINVPVRTGFHGASCAIRAFLQDRAVCSFIVPCTQDALNFDLPERGTFPRQTVREKGFFHTGSVVILRKKSISAVSSALREQILKIPLHGHEPSLRHFCRAVIFHEIKELL